MGIYVIDTDGFVEGFEDFLMGQEGEVHKDTLIEAWNRLSKKYEWDEKIIEKLEGGNQNENRIP